MKATEAKVRSSEESLKQAQDKLKVTEEQLKVTAEKLKSAEDQLSTITEKLGSAEYEKNEAIKGVKTKEEKISVLETEINKLKEVSVVM